VPVLTVVMLINGFAWISMLSSLQIAAQTSVPAWVRARALSLYIVIFSLGMATGSLIWGALAQQTSVALALICAAAGGALAGVFARRFRLGAAESLDLAPSGHWPQPLVKQEPEHDHGPVLITLEYRVAAADRARFIALMQVLGRSRRRDGATQWGVMEDTAAPGVHLEYFLLPSWLQHLRQHARVTGEEQKLQAQLRELHQGEQPPQVRHFVGGASRPPADHPHHQAHGP
jgi:MFS family permease